MILWNRSHSAALGIKVLCIHKFSLGLLLPPISSVFLSLHFSVSLASKKRQQNMLFVSMYKTKSFQFPFCPVLDVAAQNTLSRWKTLRKPTHTTEFLLCCWLMNIRNSADRTAYRKDAVAVAISLGVSCITTSVIYGSDWNSQLLRITVLQMCQHFHKVFLNIQNYFPIFLHIERIKPTKPNY